MKHPSHFAIAYFAMEQTPSVKYSSGIGKYVLELTDFLRNNFYCLNITKNERNHIETWFRASSLFLAIPLHHFFLFNGFGSTEAVSPSLDDEAEKSTSWKLSPTSDFQEIFRISLMLTTHNVDGLAAAMLSHYTHDATGHFHIITNRPNPL